MTFFQKVLFKHLGTWISTVEIAVLKTMHSKLRVEIKIIEITNIILI